MIRVPLDRDGIKRLIPHREPFLLLDRVLELEPGVRAVAEKYVRADDWWFAGHFPDRPIMPGVLQVEALAQTAAVCAMAMPEFQGGLGLFAGIDEIRFKRIVGPGDTLRVEVMMLTVPRVDLDMPPLKGQIGFRPRTTPLPRAGVRSSG